MKCLIDAFRNENSFLRNIIILSIPVLFFCIPLFLGYCWNTMGKGVGEHNTYNRPEDYKGRYPEGNLSIESMTPMIYNVPHDVALRRYILNRQLPLWSNNKGLGAPFAAQGEGSPYFPLTIIRALLPYTHWNYVTFLGFFLAGIFLYLFLKEMGVSDYAAHIGSCSFLLSGALGGQIIATNITSALTVTPLLFWALVKAMKRQTPFWRSLFSATIAIEMLAGHIQMAFVILLSLMMFCLAYIWTRRASASVRVRETIISVLYLALGIGLVAFLVLPILECLNVAYHNREVRELHFLPSSYLLAFPCPLIFGLFREAWFHVNWFDMFGYTGQAMVVAVIGGFTCFWNKGIHRSMFWTFLAIAMFWILRYTGFPLLIWLWKFPFLRELSPKHSNGFVVLCLSIAAAFAIEHLKYWKISWFISLLLLVSGTAVFTFLRIATMESSTAVQSITNYVVISIVIGLITIAVFVYARRLSSLSLTKAWQFLLVAISAELMLYIPLGNNSWIFFLLRFCLYIYILVTAILFINKGTIIKLLISKVYGSALLYKKVYGSTLLYKSLKYYKYMLVLMSVAAVAIFSMLIHIPKHGLPNQFDITVPPTHISWLKENLLPGNRTLGIRPDYQTLADIQNIDTNGPFQPYGFANFIDLVEGNVTSSEKGYFNNAYFDIYLTKYNMNKYILHKPFYDWMGVKYIILEKSAFDKRMEEYNALANPQSGLKLCYEDRAVTIFESSSAFSRAYFSESYKTYSGVPVSEELIIKFFKSNQSYIASLTLLEDPALNNLDNNVTIKSEMSTQLPVEISKFGPNYAELQIDAPSSGIVVLKDAFYPGWRAYIDNVEVPILRANGMVRAVKIDSPGKYIIEFKYMPNSFYYGVILSTAVLIFLIGSVLINKLKRTGSAVLAVSKQM